MALYHHISKYIYTFFFLLQIYMFGDSLIVCVEIKFLIEKLHTNSHYWSIKPSLLSLYLPFHKSILGYFSMLPKYFKFVFFNHSSCAYWMCSAYPRLKSSARGYMFHNSVAVSSKKKTYSCSCCWLQCSNKGKILLFQNETLFYLQHFFLYLVLRMKIKRKKNHKTTTTTKEQNNNKQKI